MTSQPAPWITRLFAFTSRRTPVAQRPAAERKVRDGIRPPKFADKFVHLDFEADAAPVISMFTPTPPSNSGRSPSASGART